MKERRFLKELNSKENENGFYTCSAVRALIWSSKDKPALNTLFNKIIGKMFKVKSYEQILSENFEYILSKTNSTFKNSLLELFIDKNLETIIKKNFSYIIKDLSRGDALSIRDFLERFKNTRPDNIEFIDNNIEEILSNVNPIHLFEVARSLKGISSNIDSVLNEKLEQNKSQVILYILDKSTKYRLTEEEREEVLKRYAKTLEIMVDELLISEGKRMLDINEIKGGSYSSVYEIGEKILKIGGTRETYEIPSHRRILQPLTRINLLDKKNRRACGCVEIANKVERNSDMDEQDEEKLYSIWKELREDGIIWTDVKSSNIGKLKGSNIPTLNNEEMYVAPNSVGFDKEINEEPLESGEWVIIDTDFIYLKKDSRNWNQLATRFERRYQQECQVRITEKQRNTKNINIAIIDEKTK